MGNPAGLNSSGQIEIEFAILGDANLDGKVNALDFNALATNFGKTPGSDVWTQGDFNYDGSSTLRLHGDGRQLQRNATQ